MTASALVGRFIAWALGSTRFLSAHTAGTPADEGLLPQRRCTTLTNTSSGLELTRAVSWAASLPSPRQATGVRLSSGGKCRRSRCLSRQRAERGVRNNIASYGAPSPPAADQPPPPRPPGVSGCLCATAARNQGGAFGAATKEGAAMVNTAVAVISHMLPRAARSDYDATRAADGAGGGTGAGPHAGRDRIAGVKSIPSGAGMWPGICRTPR
jgi:hypothetical protein